VSEYIYILGSFLNRRFLKNRGVESTIHIDYQKFLRVSTVILVESSKHRLYFHTFLALCSQKNNDSCKLDREFIFGYFLFLASPSSFSSEILRERVFCVNNLLFDEWTAYLRDCYWTFWRTVVHCLESCLCKWIQFCSSSSILLVAIEKIVETFNFLYSRIFCSLNHFNGVSAGLLLDFWEPLKGIEKEQIIWLTFYLASIILTAYLRDCYWTSWEPLKGMQRIGKNQSNLC
jgi:hypothetical protein